MITVDRITKLAKDKGITQAFISGKLGVHRNWLSCVRRDNLKISDERLTIIADILGTTVAYLKCETDDPTPEKEKSPSNDELSENEKVMLQMFRSSSPELQERFLALFETALKDKGILQ